MKRRWSWAVIVASIVFGATGSAQAAEVPNEIIVELRQPPRGLFMATAVPEFRGAVGVDFVDARHTIARLKVPPSTRDAVMDQLRHDQRVRNVQPNYVYQAFFTPNDLDYPLQWNFSKVNASTAWDFDAQAPNYGGDPSVVVAVLDTGIAYEDFESFGQATDLSGTHFVTGYDFVNSDNHPNDDHGHGTHVAGTLASTTNNSLSAAGLAFHTSLMPVKVLDATGFGTTATIASGVDYARTHGAQIVNLSLGGTDNDPALRTAVQQAVSAGILVVAAAGNSADSALAYPAAYPETISVAATRYDDTLAPYSNSGPGLSLVAPGGDLDVDQNNDGYSDGILQQSCDPDVTPKCSVFVDYWYQGTSQAAPHVSAAAALLLAAGVTSDKIQNILQSTAADLGTAGYDTTYGYGRLDIGRAMSVAIGDTTPPTGAMFINAGATYTNAKNVTVTVEAADVGSSVTGMSFSNDGQTFSPWEPYATVRNAWDLTLYGGSAVDGTKNVTVKFRDAASNVSSLVTASIILKTSKPSRPTLTVTAPSPRTSVVLRDGIPTAIRSFVASWTASTDSVLPVAGYRVTVTGSKTADLSAVSTTLDQSYTSTPVAAPTIRYFHLAAVDTIGNLSEPVTFTYVYQQPRIVASAFGSASVVIVYPNGAVDDRFTLTPSSRYQVPAIAAAVTKTGKAEELVVAGRGRGGEIRIVTIKGETVRTIKAYSSTSSTEVNIATADVNGDGTSEIIVAPRAGRFPVRVLTATGKSLAEFYPFGSRYSDGIDVAAGDVTGQGSPSIALTKLRGESTVKVTTWRGAKVRQFRAYGSRSTVGLDVAVGDVDGDGVAEIITAPFDGAAQVRIFRLNGKSLGQFFALSKSYHSGLRISTIDINGDGLDEIVTTPADGKVDLRIFTKNGKRLATLTLRRVLANRGATIAGIL